MNELHNKRPRIGVAAFITKKYRLNSLLLGKRGKEPNYGKWVLPGGAIEFGETFEEAIKREILEETNLTVSMVDDYKDIMEIIRPNEHRIILVMHAEADDEDKLQAGSDLLAVGFFGLEEIKTLDVSDVLKPILQKYGWLPK